MPRAHPCHSYLQKERQIKRTNIMKHCWTAPKYIERRPCSNCVTWHTILFLMNTNKSFVTKQNCTKIVAFFPPLNCGNLSIFSTFEWSLSRTLWYKLYSQSCSRVPLDCYRVVHRCVQSTDFKSLKEKRLNHRYKTRGNLYMPISGKGTLKATTYIQRKL